MNAVTHLNGSVSQGAAGFAKGLARASVNLAVQPGAGIVGLFSHPVKGMGKSIANSFRPELGETVLQQPRAAIGAQEARSADSRSKEAIISEFDTLATNVRERRRVLKNEAKVWLRELELQADLSKEMAAVQQGTV